MVKVSVSVIAAVLVTVVVEIMVKVGVEAVVDVAVGLPGLDVAEGAEEWDSEEVEELVPLPPPSSVGEVAGDGDWVGEALRPPLKEAQGEGEEEDVGELELL